MRQAIAEQRDAYIASPGYAVAHQIAVETPFF
jgi:hypothetical protein